MRSATEQLPGVAALERQFATFRYSVFRLEALQTYVGSGEDEGIAAFHRGDPEPPPDPAEDEYSGLLRAHRAAGQVRQRVHVVTEPVSDYMAYELAWEYGLHVPAGEDIRIIPVTDTWPRDIPVRDFWLFDSRYLCELRYDDSGVWLGVESTTDPAAVAEACFIRDAALHHALPWRDYITRHPDLVSRLPTGV
ncbi:MAG: DUF6879 family protein [Sciscionella sp.]